MATTTTPVQTTSVGLFTNQADAQAAIRDLRGLGIRDDQIGVISRHETTGVTSDPDSADGGTMAAEGAAIGAAGGAGVGALWALGIAAGALPAIGPVIAGGLLAAVLASAAGGAAAAGLVGALIGLGFSEEEAAWYEGEVKGGRTLVTVRAPGQQAAVAEVFRRNNGFDRSNPPAPPARRPK